MPVKRSIEDKISSMVGGLSSQEETLQTTIDAEKKGGRGKDLKPRTRAKKVLIGEPEIPKSFTITKSMLEEVEEVAIKENLRNFNRGIQFLLKKGLEAYKRGDK